MGLGLGNGDQDQWGQRGVLREAQGPGRQPWEVPRKGASPGGTEAVTNSMKGPAWADVGGSEVAEWYGGAVPGIGAGNREYADSSVHPRKS